MSDKIEISGLMEKKKTPEGDVGTEKLKVFKIEVTGRLNAERNIIIQRSLK